MKATLFTLATFAVVSLAKINSDDNPNKYILLDSDAIKNDVAYFSAAARGCITGYMKGMYKNTNYKVSDQCFADSTQSQLTEIVTMWGKPEQTIGDAFNKLSDSFIKISDYCDFDEALYSWLNFCYDTEQCELPNMVSTIMKKVFQVTTVANDFAQLFMEGGIPKLGDGAQKIQDFFDRAAQNVGKLLRYATDFDPTQNPIVV